jgi:hypothetical protein
MVGTTTTHMSLAQLMRKRSQESFSHLKSGMPADVLIPAPVWITVCFVVEIHSASCTTLLPTSSLLSNF